MMRNLISRDESLFIFPIENVPQIHGSFYQQPTLDIARQLLGKMLWRRIGDEVVGGIIVETEAYISSVDPASHNHRKPSPRSSVMFGPPGCAYIYAIYGMHHCLNVVTEPEGTSAAVLIRAVMPTHGVERMRQLCPKRQAVNDLAKGPGCLCQAFALTLADNATDLMGNTVWISESPAKAPLSDNIATSPRIGISRGCDLFWRFYLRGNPAVSGPKSMR